VIVRSLLMCALCLTSSQVAAGEIYALALFEGKAFLRVSNQQHLYTVGEPGLHGIQLLSSNAAQAIIKHGNRTVELSLTNGVSVQLDAAQSATAAVSIPRDPSGLFKVDGAINNLPVKFVIDTGATSIGLTTAQAAQLGVDWDVEDAQTVITASGRTTGYRAMLTNVRVGSKSLQGVAATIIEGGPDMPILLGMTFLQHFDLAIRDNMVILGSKALTETSES